MPQTILQPLIVSRRQGWPMCLLLVLFFTLHLAPLGHAQVPTGTISGTANDPTGAVLPGLTVTVTHTEKGLSRTLVTDDEGRYQAPNLAVGSYEVKAELPGFRTLVRSGIRLTVGRHAVVDLLLQIGEIADQVSVVGEAPLLETTSSSFSSLVDERRITELPLLNRDLTRLAYLQPGVALIARRDALPGERGKSTAGMRVFSFVSQPVFLSCVAPVYQDCRCFRYRIQSTTGFADGHARYAGSEGKIALHYPRRQP